MAPSRNDINRSSKTKPNKKSPSSSTATKAPPQSSDPPPTNTPFPPAGTWTAGGLYSRATIPPRPVAGQIGSSNTERLPGHSRPVVTGTGTATGTGPPPPPPPLKGTTDKENNTNDEEQIIPARDSKTKKNNNNSNDNSMATETTAEQKRTATAASIRLTMETKSNHDDDRVVVESGTPIGTGPSPPLEGTTNNYNDDNNKNVTGPMESEPNNDNGNNNDSDEVFVETGTPTGTGPSPLPRLEGTTNNYNDDNNKNVTGPVESKPDNGKPNNDNDNDSVEGDVDTGTATGTGPSPPPPLEVTTNNNNDEAQVTNTTMATAGPVESKPFTRAVASSRRGRSSTHRPAAVDSPLKKKEDGASPPSPPEAQGPPSVTRSRVNHAGSTYTTLPPAATKRQGRSLTRSPGAIAATAPLKKKEREGSSSSPPRRTRNTPPRSTANRDASSTTPTSTTTTTTTTTLANITRSSTIATRNALRSRRPAATTGTAILIRRGRALNRSRPATSPTAAAICKFVTQSINALDPQFSDEDIDEFVCTIVALPLATVFLAAAVLVWCIIRDGSHGLDSTSCAVGALCFVCLTLVLRRHLLAYFMICVELLSVLTFVVYDHAVDGTQIVWNAFIAATFFCCFGIFDYLGRFCLTVMLLLVPQVVPTPCNAALGFLKPGLNACFILVLICIIQDEFELVCQFCLSVMLLSVPRFVPTTYDTFMLWLVPSPINQLGTSINDAISVIEEVDFIQQRRRPCQDTSPVGTKTEFENGTSQTRFGKKRYGIDHVDCGTTRKYETRVGRTKRGDQYTYKVLADNNNNDDDYDGNFETINSSATGTGPPPPPPPLNGPTNDNNDEEQVTTSMVTRQERAAEAAERATGDDEQDIIHASIREEDPSTSIVTESGMDAVQRSLRQYEQTKVALDAANAKITRVAHDLTGLVHHLSHEQRRQQRRQQKDRTLIERLRQEKEEAESRNRRLEVVASSADRRVIRLEEELRQQKDRALSLAHAASLNHEIERLRQEGQQLVDRRVTRLEQDKQKLAQDKQKLEMEREELRPACREALSRIQELEHTNEVLVSEKEESLKEKQINEDRAEELKLGTRKAKKEVERLQFELKDTKQRLKIANRTNTASVASKTTMGTATVGGGIATASAANGSGGSVRSIDCGDPGGNGGTATEEGEEHGKIKAMGKGRVQRSSMAHQNQTDEVDDDDTTNNKKTTDALKPQGNVSSNDNNNISTSTITIEQKTGKKKKDKKKKKNDADAETTTIGIAASGSDEATESSINPTPAGLAAPILPRKHNVSKASAIKSVPCGDDNVRNGGEKVQNLAGRVDSEKNESIGQEEKEVAEGPSNSTNTLSQDEAQPYQTDSAKSGSDPEGTKNRTLVSKKQRENKVFNLCDVHIENINVSGGEGRRVRPRRCKDIPKKYVDAESSVGTKPKRKKKKKTVKMATEKENTIECPVLSATSTKGSTSKHSCRSERTPTTEKQAKMKKSIAIVITENPSSNIDQLAVGLDKDAERSDSMTAQAQTTKSSTTTRNNDAPNGGGKRESNPVTNDGGAKSNGVHDLDNEQDSIKKGVTGLDWSECNSNTEAESPSAGAGVLPFVNLPILGRVSNVSGITNHFDDNDTNATETDANDAETEDDTMAELIPQAVMRRFN